MAAFRYTTSVGGPLSRFRLPAWRAAFGATSEPGLGSIVPANSIAGNALMSVVAIMSFLACLTIGGVTLVRDTASDWQSDISREITIQVRPIDGVDVDAEAAKAAELARATPGVGSAEALDASQNAALLQPWLGDGLDIGDLPIPRLVVITLADPATADLSGLSRRLAEEVRGASLDDHRVWTERLRTMAGATVIVGFGILALVFTATVLSVVFATRGAMAGNKDIVSVLHLVGAENGFIAGEFQRHFLVLGLKGGLAGAIAAIIVFVILGLLQPSANGSPESAQMAALFGRFAIGPTAYLGALGIAVVIALLTAITSRLTVFRYLGHVE